MSVHPIPGFHEPFNSLSHLGGAVVFACLGIVLLRRGRGDVRRVCALGVFVLTSVILLTASGLFHMLPEESGWQPVMGRLDHAAIFALIAGTHTPLQGLFFRGRARWGMLAFMWITALTGIVLFTLFYERLHENLGPFVYLALGWIAGSAGVIVRRRFGPSRVRLLFLGGLVYSVGAVLLVLEWPTVLPGVIGPHEVWHVAVLLGLALHWGLLLRNAGVPCVGSLAEHCVPVARGNQPATS